MARRIVLTGGPSSGKTSIIEVAERHFGGQIITVPEAASMLLSGGFPRGESAVRRKAAQRAIYRVALELERWAAEEAPGTVALCDRGTLDSGAWWPGSLAGFLRSVGTNRATEFARYATVIHLNTPAAGRGYPRWTDRVETAAEAKRLDLKLRAAWEGHPNVHVVSARKDFQVKVENVISILEQEIPRRRP